MVKVPSAEEASALMPKGRIPYILVRDAILTPDDDLKDWRVSNAVTEIHHANVGSKLQPPLTKELSEAIQGLYSTIDSSSPNRGIDPVVGGLVLSAVFEHGYRSNSATVELATGYAAHVGKGETAG